MTARPAPRSARGVSTRAVPPDPAQGGIEDRPALIRVRVLAAAEIEAAGLVGVLRAGSGFEVDDPWVAVRVDPHQMLAGDPDVLVLGAAAAGYEWLLTISGQLAPHQGRTGLLAVVDRPRSGWLSRLAAGGISGIAELGTPGQQLRTAVMAVAGGHDWMSAGVSTQLAELWRLGEDGLAPEELTNRELAVLRTLAAGADNAQVATALGISQSTVASHVKSVCSKLRASSRLHAVAIGIRHGLIDP